MTTPNFKNSQLGITISPDHPNVGIGTNSPVYKLDVIGTGRFVHSDGACGLLVEDTGGSGIHIGDCALGANVRFAGMKHSDYNMTTDYMIISDGTDTYISAKNDGSVYLRPGGNAGEGGIIISDVGAGGVSTVFNEAGSNRDIRMEGSSDVNLFRLDAGEDRIGIGIATPSTKLHVSGIITANGGNSTNWNTAYGWGDHSTLYATTGELSSVSGHLQTQIDATPTGHINVSGATNNYFYQDAANNFFVHDLMFDQYGHTTGVILGQASGFVTSAGIDGDGVSNYVAIWDDADTLTSGVIYQNGDNIGIGTSTPAYNLDVTGVGRFVHSDGVCGLLVEDTGGSGVHIGDCAYSDGDTYTGMKHSNHTHGQEYMIISAGHSTVVSSKAGTSTYIRAGGNATTYQGVFGTSSFGIGPNANRLRVNSQSVILNNGTGNYDFKVYGHNNATQLIHADAALHRVGIGTATPATKLDVSGVITATGGDSTTWNTGYALAFQAYSWGNHALAGYSTTDTQLSDEQVEDIVSGMVSGNTETGITVTYQDNGAGNGKLDFVVASQTDENFTTDDHDKLDGIEANADVTDATNVDAAGAVMNSDTSIASMSFVVDEDTMSSNSATKVPTQQSVKAYVDTEAVRPAYIMSIMFG